MTNVVEMKGITKAFGANIAVNDVSISLPAGRVRALMGENGAGKSTLMKVLAGVHIPDQGQVLINGAPVTFSNPKQALEAGVSTVFQELSLLPNLTIAENMFLGREIVNRFGVLDRDEMELQTASALSELGLDLNPATLVSELSIAQRQFVEIAHGIKADAYVFVLDEPTAALNAADVEVLNRQITRLKQAGKAIVYISHRMEEIFETCDDVTVMKDGAHVASRSLAELTPEGLIALMVGRELSDLFPARGENPAEVLMSCVDLKLSENAAPVSFDLHAGEILGLAGLEGQGQREIVRSFFGDYAPVSGRVTIGTHTTTLPLAENEGIRTQKALGVGFVPEDRKEEGLLLGLSIRDNIDIGAQSGRSALSVTLKLRKLVAETMEKLKVKATSASAPVASLSGGNQQKVLLGRYLAADMNVLVIEEPTRGVDIGAKAEIYALLRKLADSGKAILVLSRETVELIGLCDRLLVVHDKAIAVEMAGKDATEHAILDAALNT
ncbi:sugar ABC transporter ATP-binding protein [Ruegeria jejuensis]|uniref:sugar ABC transporter ATP-binding protein n=1 Tax=Ruegeria jejuensis TaxID=3233338 RepID=UPI00355BB678